MLAGMMAVTTLAGCGSGGKQAASKVDTSEAAQGKVLNIYCWNTEFQDRFEYFKKSGKLPSDVKVNFVVTPNENNAYQNALDAALLKQNDVPADEKIDIFLIEADYALKYVDSDYTLDVVNDIGLSKDALADQYQYTKDVMTDSDGNLKGLSWQGCPGAMIYRRDIAKEVFGSDDPAEVQKKVADWDTFKATAEELKEKGYQMTSTVNDAYRVFSNNVTSPWVVDGKITVDDNIKNWVDMSKEMVDAGETATYELWSDDWSKGFFKDSNVFSYFGPAWFIDFSMSADQDGSVGKDGGWAATEGPQGFYWGGTWITAAAGTDNPTLVADIMRTMTTNVDVMKEIVTADNDFVNNKPAMEEMAKDESYGDAVLGGQNPLAMFCAGADKIDLSNMSIYDQGCNEEFQNAMKNYFEGNASYDEALDLFYKAVVEKYPELSY
mgnify:CR=1 FL=1